jgi:hypothetical protein
LHVNFFPSVFTKLICYLFDANLAIVISGALENRFSKNIFYLERQTEMAMSILPIYVDDNLLPVNIIKIKVLLMSDVVVPLYLKVK